ncbi:peptidylprolyl isomerase [Pseudonocardia sp. GCM10023141]|uniref:peptidylprolyl isomerase n=1 Tax=Pseudonocardia sp. GCM10023141 TaxID=3252653 RepID=UPI003606E520
MATNQMRREAAKRKLERQQQRRVQQAKRRQRTAIIASVSVVVVVVIGLIVLTNLPSSAPPPAAAPSTAAPSTDAPSTATPVTPASIPTAITALPKRATPLAPTVSCTYKPGGTAAKPVQPPAGTDISTVGTVAMNLQTSAGAIPLTLDRSLAPCTVNSIVSLAQQGYFTNSPCHRLTTDPGLQVLQCGDPSGTGSGGPGYTVPDEFYPEMAYGRGILAMANTGQPDSGGGQFFMIYGDAQLPKQYTVFGSISPEGLQVIDTIAKAGHDGSFDAQAGGGKPITPVIIQTATLS